MPTVDVTAQSTLTQDGTTAAWTHTLGSGSNRKVLVGVHDEGNNASTVVVSGVTFDGVAAAVSAAVIDHRPSNRSQRTEIWYIDETDLPAAGDYTIVVTITGVTDGLWGASVSLIDAAQGAPEATSTGTSTADNITTSITTQSADAVIVDMVGFGLPGGSDLVPGESGQTQRAEIQSDDFDAATSTMAVAVAAASDMTWTGGAALRCSHALVSIADEAPAAGGDSPTWRERTSSLFGFQRRV